MRRECEMYRYAHFIQAGMLLVLLLFCRGPYIINSTVTIGYTGLHYALA